MKSRSKRHAAAARNCRRSAQSIARCSAANFLQTLGVVPQSWHWAPCSRPARARCGPSGCLPDSTRSRSAWPAACPTPRAWFCGRGSRRSRWSRSAACPTPRSLSAGNWLTTRASPAACAGARCWRGPSTPTACMSRSTGLPSGRHYFYRFHAADATSPLGRTRTAPAQDAPAGRLRIALASCQHYEQGAFALHQEISERDLDLVLFVGDYIYESSNPRYRLRAHEGPRPSDLAGYRRRHATYKLDPSLRAAHAAHPWLLTWDDHEVENDYADEASSRGRTQRGGVPGAARGGLQGLLRAHAGLAFDGARGRGDAHPCALPMGPAGRPVDAGQPPVPLAAALQPARPRRRTPADVLRRTG